MAKNKYEELSAERKQMQLDGTMPEFFSTGSWQMFKSKYLYEAKTVKEQYQRIAKTAAAHMPDGNDWEARFFEILWKGWVSCSTPILANMGTNRGMPVSCSGQYVGDSINEFYKSRHETAILTKHGFGTSGYLNDIRARGSDISVGGTASGPLPVFKGFIQDMRDVAQGTARRGSFAAYFKPTHGDFDEIIHFVESNPDDANLGWTITDEFVKGLNDGNPEYHRRFKKTQKVKMVTGKGYYHFIDKVNRYRPQAYINNNLYVTASNLCFSGDTKVAVADGRNAVSIKQLAEENVQFEVYSANKSKAKNRGIRGGGLLEGSNWKHDIKKAKAFKTGIREIIELTLSNGDTFKCTPDHPLATVSGEWVEAQYCVGLELEPFATYKNSMLKYKGLSVISIVSAGIEDVYDLSVEADNYDSHSFYIITGSEDDKHLTSRGVLVHNCSEIELFSDSYHTFTCVLSSMNASKYPEWKDTDAVFVATVFLHCVALEFIKKAKGIEGLEKAVRATEKGMALGLGVCGFHTYLQSQMIPFESLEAMMFNNILFKGIQEKSKAASAFLATVFGEPEWCKGTGFANTHTMAVAPTKSTALIMGGVSEGINPDPAMTFTQLTAAGEVDRANPILLALMKKKGVYDRKHWQELVESQGSVQGVDWLDDYEKMVFRTAFEINQEAILRMASQRQRFIDQGQSVNLFFSADADEAYIARIHQIAFEDEMIHALYYIYSKAGVSGSKGEECIACQ